MKTGDKILELLAEYLQKTDRTLERMEKTDKKIDLAYDVLVKHSEELISLRKETEELRNESLSLRKESLKREVQQEALLKEIFSISRRVSNLEDKK